MDRQKKSIHLTLSARLATSVDIYNKRDANVSFDLFNAALFFVVANEKTGIFSLVESLTNESIIFSLFFDWPTAIQ